MTSKRSRNKDIDHDKYSDCKPVWHIFTILLTLSAGLLFVQLLTYYTSTYNQHSILGKPLNQVNSDQLSVTKRIGMNPQNSSNVNANTSMVRSANRVADNDGNNTNHNNNVVETASRISKMSSTETNTTTNANSASPFPPKMANQTGFFPPDNKAEIVMGAALLRDKAYQPNPVLVKAGGSITWTNLDTVVHTITSGKGITDPTMGTKFDSGMLGGSFTQRFFKPGTFSYFCQIHPTMVGVVIVK